MSEYVPGTEALILCFCTGGHRFVVRAVIDIDEHDVTG